MGGPVHDVYTRLERVSASPGTVEAIMSMVLELDVRPVLSTISSPTLVIHRAGNEYVGAEHGRYLAEHIPTARYVELPGSDHHYFFGDADGLLDEVQEFLTGVRAPAEPDRVLATVLFTDVVSSSGRTARVGRPALARSAGRSRRHPPSAGRALPRKGDRREPATALYRPSTDQHARFSARARSPQPSAVWTLRSAPGSTPESWTCSTATSWDSP